MKNNIDRKINEIEKGIYSFREIGDLNIKNQIANILIEKYSKNELSDIALKSLIDFYIDQIIIFKRYDIDSVPIEVRELVKDNINKLK